MARNKITPLDPHDLADKLFKIREEIAAYQDVLKPLEEKEEILRADMLTALKRDRLDTFRDDNVPLTFTRVYRASLGVTNEAKALKWAIENKCAKVDTVKANTALKGKGALPDGFEQKSTESLQVRTV